MIKYNKRKGIIYVNDCSNAENLYKLLQKQNKLNVYIYISKNQIVAFILAVFLCFIFYFGFDGIASLFKSNTKLIASFGMDYHFKSMSRGVIDTRDVTYFVSIAVTFLSLTVYKLKSLKS